MLQPLLVGLFLSNIPEIADDRADRFVGQHICKNAFQPNVMAVFMLSTKSTRNWRSRFTAHFRNNFLHVRNIIRVYQFRHCTMVPICIFPAIYFFGRAAAVNGLEGFVDEADAFIAIFNQLAKTDISPNRNLYFFGILSICLLAA